MKSKRMVCIVGVKSEVFGSLVWCFRKLGFEVRVAEETTQLVDSDSFCPDLFVAGVGLSNEEEKKVVNEIRSLGHLSPILSFKSIGVPSYFGLGWKNALSSACIAATDIVLGRGEVEPECARLRAIGFNLYTCSQSNMCFGVGGWKRCIDAY